MPEKDPYNWKYLGFYLLAIFFSIGGGLSKHASLWQVGRAQFTKSEIIAQSIISSFAGSLVTLYMVANGYSLEMTLIGAGLGGFGGTTLLYFISNRILKQIDPDTTSTMKEPKKKERKDDE